MSRNVPLYENGNMVDEIEFNWEIKNRGVCLYYKTSKGLSGQTESHDLFYALGMIRKEFDEKGLSVLCKGGLKDAFVGGYISNSSHGEIAYLLKNNQSIEESTINIFDGIEISEISELATLEEQKDIRRSWIQKNRVRLP